MFSIILALAALAAPPAPPTLQQQFNAASVAAAEGRCSEAVAAFDALEARTAVNADATLLATIRARKAGCLVNLWRLDDAARASHFALGVLGGAAASSRDDVAEAHLQLGKVAYFSFDYEEAVREFTAAESLQSGYRRIDALAWLAQATMFVVDDRAISYSAQALGLASADPARQQAALNRLQSLHARALLNHGRQVEAYAELRGFRDAKDAAKSVVGLDDLIVRLDLALAAALTGHDGSARAYLASTGAGRFGKVQLDHPLEDSLPPCGGSAAIRPEDFAVVEFSIEDDGTVRHVLPIYASRSGPMAQEFARSVAAWSWGAANAHSIPRLFRSVTRIAVRCSSAALAHPDALDRMHADLDAWLSQRGLAPLAGDMRRAATVELARSGVAGGQPVTEAQLPLLLALASSPLPADAERQKWFRQARDLCAALGAPIGALTYLDLASYRLDAHWTPAGQRAYLRTLLTSAEVAADPGTAGMLRLLISRAAWSLPAPGDARQLLEATATDPALPDRDPVKIAALLRLAALQAADKDFVAAAASYAKTGLSSQQCSLFDLQPAIRSTGATRWSFPREALDWGFSGWVVLEFDVQADGKTANQRAVISYPPVVFDLASITTAKGMRYETSYRPDGGLGCDANQVFMTYISRR